MKKVSIVIPVYNVEMYLGFCINSVLLQTYQNIEILLVDDGSTDHSGAICDAYSANDSRIRVIHKSNGGLSDARNIGIKHCTGDYIGFIDSDDFVDLDYVKCLVEIMETYNADMSIVNSVATATETVSKNINSAAKVIVFGPEDALEDMLYQRRISTSAWAKLFKKDLFKEIRFPYGKLFEDINTIYKALDQSKKIVYTDSVKYYYRIRRDSIVHSGFNPKKFDYVYNCGELCTFISKNYPDLRPAAISRMLWAAIHVWVNIDNPKKYKEQYQKVYAIIKRYRRQVLIDKKVRKKNKLVIFTSFGGWRVSRGVYLLTTKLGI